MVEARRRNQAKQDSGTSGSTVEATVGVIESPEDYPTHVKDVKDLVSRYTVVCKALLVARVALLTSAAKGSSCFFSGWGTYTVCVPYNSECNRGEAHYGFVVCLQELTPPLAEKV